MRVRHVLASTGLAAVLVGCGSNAGASPSGSVLVIGSGSLAGVVPVVANNTMTVCTDRLLFLLLDQQKNVPVSSPSTAVKVAVAPASGGTTPAPESATFVWGIPNQRGYYFAPVSFPKGGDYHATFTITPSGTAPTTATVDLSVGDAAITAAVGSKAPSVKTPTLSDVGGDIKQVSTDTSPDPRFYQQSEDAALAAHRPFALLLATPAFCTSGLCGPTLDRVKAMVDAYPTVTFINVEPYKMQFTDGRLQPVLDANGGLQANAVSDAFGITAEPWLFTVDRNGVIRGSLEAVMSDEELKTALDAIR
jgi:hypothetical protein